LGFGYALSISLIAKDWVLPTLSKESASFLPKTRRSIHTFERSTTHPDFDLGTNPDLGFTFFS